MARLPKGARALKLKEGDMKTKVQKRVVPKPLTPEQKRGLEDVDELLRTLIRQNRLLHARVDRLARAVSGLGEPEIDRVLKALRRRLQNVGAERKVVPARRRAHAA